MFNGQLSWYQDERERTLGLLLELVGADKAVQQGMARSHRQSAEVAVQHGALRPIERVRAARRL